METELRAVILQYSCYVSYVETFKQDIQKEIFVC